MFRGIKCVVFILLLEILFLATVCESEAVRESSDAQIRQLTFSTKNHELDNNDNFSFDDKYLCYDTRGTIGPGIENCISIEVVNIQTGKEYVVYSPEKVRIGSKPAPGIGAVSFHPKEYQLIFIHGPEVTHLYGDIENKDIYAKNNRRGAIVDLDTYLIKQGRNVIEWVDMRDTSCGKPIIKGAHRGGSHRHEYSANGKKLGCTYDDYLLPQYGRTIAYFEPTDLLKPNADYYFALLVNVVLPEEAKDGDIIKALGDSWVDSEGKMRAFIGTVKEGDEYVDYLCIVNIPDSVNIQTADSGTCTTYLKSPEGVVIHKITKVFSSGIVRGSPDGKRIAYLNKDNEGKTQIFILNVPNMNDTNEIEMKPIQASFLSEGVEDNIRWHPSGKTIFSISDGSIVAICVEEGDHFAESVFLTSKYYVNKPYAIVVSRKGDLIAFNRVVPTCDEYGNRHVTFDGKDFSQIFIINYNDEDNDGLPDS